MTIKLIHEFHSPKTDGPDSTDVKPSDWNAEHDFETDQQGIILGRDTSGSGVIQELPVAVDPDGSMHLSGGALELPSGTTADRPAPPANGMIRYNSDTNSLEAYVGGAWLPVQVGPTVPVGSTIGWYSQQAPLGYLFVNGQTIGPTAAGSADHASDQYQALYEFLWTNVASCKASITGGPGASADADWAANKIMTLPNECGAVSAGSDTMGGVASHGYLNKSTNPLGPDGTIVGDVAGESMHIQTVPEMPNHNHPWTGGNTGGSSGLGGVGGGSLLWDSGPGSIGLTGGGQAMNNVQRTMIKNVIIKW